jgi:hypothetical protein
VGSALNAAVTAGGSVWLFGFGLTGQVTAAGDANAVSFGNLHLQPVNVGGTLRAYSTTLVTVVGTAGNVQLGSHGGIASSITAAGTLSAWSLGPIAGSLASLLDVSSIVTWSDLSATVTAGRDIGRIHVWGIISGDITAGQLINEIYAGAGISGTISAPVIGWVVIGDRSPFVDLPAVPVAPIGNLVATTVEAYTALVTWQQDLAAAAIELASSVTAVQGEIAAKLAQAVEDLALVQFWPKRKPRPIGPWKWPASTRRPRAWRFSRPR